MAVVMRKKRSWSTRADDAESQESEAFEAHVRAQNAAVESDRQRHERWLQRQRNYRLAAAKKERQRRRRRLMWQRAFQAMRHAVGAGLLFVRSWVVLAVAKIWAGISAGASWTGSNVLASARAGSAALESGSSVAVSKAAALSRKTGRSLGSGWSVVSDKSSVLVDNTSRTTSRGLTVAGRNALALQAAAKQNAASGFRWAKTYAAAVMPALYVSMAKLGRQVERYSRARAEGIMARTSAKAPVPEPIALYGPHAEGAGVSPNEPRTSESTPAPTPTPAESLEPEKNALSSLSSLLSSWAEGARSGAGVTAARTRILLTSWMAQAKVWANEIQTRIRTRDVELSRMMIIAGAVLLVCGGLLLGGGLFLRAGAGTAAEEEERGTGITWMFLQTERSLPERAVFTLSGTPASFRINGLSVGGVNLSGHSLTAVEGVLKPDVTRPDLKLTLEVDLQTAPESEGDADVQAVAPVGTVPAGAAFRLVFSFPPEVMGEEDGITVDDYFDAYGGLLLKLRYEVDGTQKSIIQYLPPDALRAQLDEVSAEADS